MRGLWVALFFSGSLLLSAFFLRRFMERREVLLNPPAKFKILTTLRPRKLDGEPIESALAFGRAIAIQNDGRMVAAGSVCSGSGQKNCEFALVRFLPDGRLDLSFNSSGKTAISFASDETGDQDGAYALALQTDGKIIVAGQMTRQKHTFFAVARLDSDGQMDPTFGDNGKVMTDVSLASDPSGGGAHAVALQEDGKILAAGGNHCFTLVRYNPDGSRDTFFGETGRVSSHFGTSDTVNALAVQNDGKVVAAGNSRIGDSHSFVIARYNADGTLDSGFANSGSLIIDNDTRGPWEEGQTSAVALQRDGKIVLLGDYRNGKDNDFVLYRFNNDGTVDPSFGMKGKVVTDVSFGQLSHEGHASAIAVTPNDKILVLGNIATTEGETRFVLVRHLWDGKLDTTFGNDGKSVLDFDTDAEARAVALQPDGKIVVVGDAAGDGEDRALAVARYRAGGAIDNLSSAVARDKASVDAH